MLIPMDVKKEFLIWILFAPKTTFNNGSNNAGYQKPSSRDLKITTFWISVLIPNIRRSVDIFWLVKAFPLVVIPLSHGLLMDKVCQLHPGKLSVYNHLNHSLCHVRVYPITWDCSTTWPTTIKTFKIWVSNSIPLHYILARIWLH